MKEFDKIQTVRDKQKPNIRKLYTPVKTTIKENLQILWLKTSTQMMPSIWEEMCEVQQDEPFPRGVQECKKQHSPQYRAGS